MPTSTATATGDRMSRRSGLLLAVAAILALGRYLVAAGGSFYSDDFALRLRAATQPLDWTYLTQSYNGHVNPVGWVLAWAVQRAAPGSFTVVCLVLALMWLLITLCLGRLVLRLTHRWQVAVAAMVFVSLSSFQFEVSTWWSAALYALPYQLCVLLSVTLFVASLDTGRASLGWLATAAYGLAALSFSRGVLALVLIVGVVCLLPWRSDSGLGLRAGWSWGRQWWLTCTAIAIGGAVAVIARTSSAGQLPEASVTELLAQWWTLLLHNCLPGIWGGPLTWIGVPLAGGWPVVLLNPAPAAPVVAVSVVLSVAATLLLIMRVPMLRAFTYLTLGWVLAVTLMGAMARAGNPLASPSYRYTFDAVWPVVLLGASALTLVPRVRVTRVARGAAASLLIGVLVWSIVPAVGAWQDNLGRQYLANAVSTFATIPPGQAILSQGVPPGLVDPALLAPYSNTASVMTPEAQPPRFAEAVTGELYGFASSGAVDRQQVVGPRSLPGPDPDCGYRVDNTARAIALDGDVIAWGFYARIAYFAGQPTTLNVAFGDRITTVDLEPQGLRAVYFPVSGPGNEMLVSTGTLGATVCITDVVVGNRTGSDGQVVPLVPTGEVS